MIQPEQPAILVLGGINIDLVSITPRFPEAGETVVGSSFLTYPGGKGANQAVAAARMGAKVFMVGRVGTDIFGTQLVEALRDSGVDVSAVGFSGTNSGIAAISIDDSAQNRIIQILGANDTCGEVEAGQISQLLPGMSTLMLQLEVSIELSLRAAREALALGKTVILDPGPVRPLPEEFYSLCTVITPNETEAQALVGFPVTDRESAAQAAGALLSRGVKNVVVKLGEQGAYYATAAGGEQVRAFPVLAIDSVGAGDAFNGALAVALAEGMALGEAVRIACAAGGLAASKVGAQDSMPERAEVELLRRSQNS
ncbi:MAG: ribokinase [Chloroflexi bacterium]|nr:ribokinase [Chloroflexota bacterium]